MRLGKGECDEFKDDGFTCIEHYKCAGEDLRLITDGESTTRFEIKIIFTFKPHFSLEWYQLSQRFQSNRKVLDFQANMNFQ